uniref:Putative ixostatin n=1 Tax=Ixodes ricinus TaxID=34613 RepID=A0A0K8R472_IXORI
MISTRILLLLAALVLACIAEDSCPKVSEDIFRRLRQSATKLPHNSLVGLGVICKQHFFKNATNVMCIGDSGTAYRDCLLCCACSGDAGITYSNRTAPNGYPCKKNGNDKCNSKGQCENKKRVKNPRRGCNELQQKSQTKIY